MVSPSERYGFVTQNHTYCNALLIKLLCVLYPVVLAFERFGQRWRACVAVLCEKTPCEVGWIVEGEGRIATLF